MSKQIIIIGGGISGLSTLHFLKKKYVGRRDIQIRLLEKENKVGGTAKTHWQNQVCFETGPNGFLDSKETAIELAKDLGLEHEMIRSNPDAKKRYISISNTLYQLPTSPATLFKFKPISILDILRIPLELFIPRGKNVEESVHEFFARRFGRTIADVFVDAFTVGIFGSDARKLNMKESFPKVYRVEQKFGSVIAGLFRIKGRKKRKSDAQGNKQSGNLVSFKKGMGQMCDTLQAQYDESISRNEEVLEIDRAGEGFSVESKKMKYYADELFLCSPAYVSAQLLKNFDAVFSEMLDKVKYTPLAVVGLVYKRESIGRKPEGFGYLIPTTERKDVLGVLFTSNIYDGRTDDKHFMFRVMIGGIHNPNIPGEPRENLVAIAENEIKSKYSINDKPVEEFCAHWPEAIPMYDQEYVHIKEGILFELRKFKNLYIIANYIGGISFGDCIENARKAVDASNL